jgi:hypothetical protein
VKAQSFLERVVCCGFGVPALQFRINGTVDPASSVIASAMWLPLLMEAISGVDGVCGTAWESRRPTGKKIDTHAMISQKSRSLALIA